MSGPSTNPTIVGVDIGGTFTDFVVATDAGFRVHKMLSTPDDPARAVLQGLRELGVGPEANVVHGSTVATNALLERKGARTALVTTEGFEDVLEIGRQNRSSLYDFLVTRPEPLAPEDRRFGAAERVGSDGGVLRELTEEEARRVARQVKESGAEAVAVCFLFSFLNPEHEERVMAALAEAGVGPYVYLSSRVLPEYREYERTSTTVASAYVAPVVHRYLTRLGGELGESLRIVTSSGGSVTGPAAVEQPVQTISGGPAGGVVGAFRLSQQAGYDKIICFDMGGTSTDVCLCDGGIPKTTSWSLGGLPLKTPAIDVYSVGAGGGSIARVDAGGALTVGPDSAGADPGPACYGKGDQPAVTDANLVLGRLSTDGFTVGGRPLNRERSEDALRPIADLMGVDIVHAAGGVVRVANANMERAIRVVSVERGHDPREFTLVAFGGAGPLHACEMAEALSIPRVLVPLHPGVLSAQGMAFADISREYSATVMLQEPNLDLAEADKALDILVQAGQRDLGAMGVTPGDISAAMSLDLRYEGQSFEINVSYAKEPLEQVLGAFHEAHRRQYGYAHEGRGVEVVNVRARVAAPGARPPAASTSGGSGDDAALGRREVVFEGRAMLAELRSRAQLEPGAEVLGPAIVTQYDSVTVVPPGWRGRVDDYLNLILERYTDGPRHP